MGTDTLTDGPSEVTVLVPARDEADFIGQTLESIQAQTYPPAETIVIDDCSTDKTAEIAEIYGATVLRSTKRLGSKAASQNYALPSVRTKYVGAVDADTVLDKHAIELMIDALKQSKGMGASSWVLPKHASSVWERGRFVEYMFAFAWYKQIQNLYGYPLICSGCLNIYETEKLRAMGGYPNATVTEDLDLTWRIYEDGIGRILFVPEALCFPSEPNNLATVRKQLKRWSFGFQLNMKAHWRNILRIPRFRLFAFTAWIEGTIAALYYLIAVPLIYLFLGWVPIAMLVITDWIIMAIPAMIGAHRFGITRKALEYLPSYYILRMVNSFYFLYAFFAVWVFNRKFGTYEKGH